jgi:hypothetical protein
MKNLSENRIRFFKGAGWLIGIAISMISAIVVLILFDSFTIAISSTIPMGVIIGMSLDQKFQDKSEIINPRKNKVTIYLLLSGIIIFLAFLAIYYLA